MSVIAFALFGWVLLSLWLSEVTYYDPHFHGWSDLGLAACFALGFVAACGIRIVNSSDPDMTNLPPRRPEIDPLGP
jgi:hypothetical protein